MVLLLCEVEFILILLFLEARLHVLVMFGEQWAGVVHIIASKTGGNYVFCNLYRLLAISTRGGCNNAGR